jgi:hypothetical protein
VGSRAVLDAVVKSNIPSLHRESNPRTALVQPIAQRYTDIRQILEKKWEYNGTVHQLFIEFKEAYDSGENLYNILLEFGISKKLVRLIKCV